MAKLKATNPYAPAFFEEPGSTMATRAAPDEGAKVRLNVDIDKGLHRALKQLALDQDRNVATLVREALAGVIEAAQESIGALRRSTCTLRVGPARVARVPLLVHVSYRSGGYSC